MKKKIFTATKLLRKFRKHSCRLQFIPKTSAYASNNFTRFWRNLFVLFELFHVRGTDGVTIVTIGPFPSNLMEAVRPRKVIRRLVLRRRRGRNYRWFPVHVTCVSRAAWCIVMISIGGGGRFFIVINIVMVPTSVFKGYILVATTTAVVVVFVITVRRGFLIRPLLFLLFLPFAIRQSFFSPAIIPTSAIVVFLFVVVVFR